MLRDALRWIRGRALEWSGANRLARARLDGTRAAILMYHRVLPRTAARAVEPGMFVTPETFRQHLAWLREEFQVLPLHEIVERLCRRASLPPRACALTFDDGWRDNHDHALPALEASGFPATIFLVTERVGTSGAYWPDEVCRRLGALPEAEQRELVRDLGGRASGDPVPEALALLKARSEEQRVPALEMLRGRTPAPADSPRELLDWDEIARMARTDIDFESHGATHAILTGLGEGSIVSELRASREALLSRGYGRHSLLAYPSGGHDARVRRLAGEVGYRACVTTELGLADAASDPFALPRLGLHEDVSASRADFHRLVPGSAFGKPWVA